MEDVRELELTEGEMEAAVDLTITCKSIVDQDMMASDWSALISYIQTASELTNRRAVLSGIKPCTKIKMN